MRSTLLTPLHAALLCLVLSACSPRAADGGGTGQCRILQRPVPISAPVEETSGVAMGRRNPGVLWTHNDSGGEPVLFAIDPRGNSLGRVRVAGAENRDWEDIALGPCPAGECLYIGDIGDNLAERGEIVIWRVPEPVPGASETASAERFPARYPQGPRDAEALFTLPSGDLFILAKGWGHPVALYRYPAPLRPDETVELELVRSLSQGPVAREHQVTGADATADGRWVAVRTYTALLFYGTEDLLGEGDPLFRVDLRPLGEPQGEAVSFGSGGAVVLTSEGGASGIPGWLSLLDCTLPAQSVD